jgi:glycerol-3-phosphate acyltransferase PlsY
MGLMLCVLAAYLLGSVNGALLIGRFKGVDIRESGSGNAGGTNALRTQGPLFALGVVVIDILKGWLAAGWLPGLLPAAGPLSVGPSTLAGSAAACGFAAIVGHVWPVFHGFRGGKGVATLLGAVAALSPLALAGVLGTWLLMMFVFGFVGLGSIVAACALPALVWALGVEPAVPSLAFGLGCAGLVAWTHRANLARMRAGTEPRARRLWLLGRLRRA